MIAGLHGNEYVFSTYMEIRFSKLLLLQTLKQNKKSSLKKPEEFSGAAACLKNFPCWQRPAESHDDAQMLVLHQT